MKITTTKELCSKCKTHPVTVFIDNKKLCGFCAYKSLNEKKRKNDVKKVNIKHTK